MIIQRKRSNAVLNRGGQESRWGAIFPQRLWERPVLILILEMEVD
jgi:hypothetical protein